MEEALRCGYTVRLGVLEPYKPGETDDIVTAFWYEGHPYNVPLDLKFGLLMMNKMRPILLPSVVNLDEVVISVTPEAISEWESSPEMSVIKDGHRVIGRIANLGEIVTVEMELGSTEDEKKVTRTMKACVRQFLQHTMADMGKIQEFDWELMTTEQERKVGLLGVKSGLILGDYQEIGPRLKTMIYLLGTTGSKALRVKNGWLRWNQGEVLEWREDLKIAKGNGFVTYTDGDMIHTFSYWPQHEYLIDMICREVGEHGSVINSLTGKLGINTIMRKPGEVIKYGGLLSAYVMQLTGSILLATLVYSYEELMGLDYDIPLEKTEELKKALRKWKRDSEPIKEYRKAREYDDRMRRDKKILLRAIMLEGFDIRSLRTFLDRNAPDGK